MWEYLLILIDTYSFGKKGFTVFKPNGDIAEASYSELEHPARMFLLLNDLGGQGWELASQDPKTDIIYFKRPKPD